MSSTTEQPQRLTYSRQTRAATKLLQIKKLPVIIFLFIIAARHIKVLSSAVKEYKNVRPTQCKSERKVIYDIEMFHTVHFLIVPLHSTNKCNKFSIQNQNFSTPTCFGAHAPFPGNLVVNIQNTTASDDYSNSHTCAICPLTYYQISIQGQIEHNSPRGMWPYSQPSTGVFVQFLTGSLH
jgi:hypothetical protein